MDNKYTLIKEIDNLLSKKDYIKARKLIRNDLKRLGTKDEYYLYSGLASIEPEERIKNYEKSINANPQNLDAIINLANAQDEIGEYDKALANYNKALELDDKCALAYNNRGFTYYQKKEYEKALNDYNKAIFLNPKLQIAEDNKQKLINELKNKPEYTKILEESKKETQNYKYYFNLGLAEARNGNLTEAEEAYDKSIDLNPHYAPCYLFKGILKHSQEKYEEAKENYTKAIEEDEKTVDAYFNRAQIVFAKKSEDKKEIQEAMQDLERSIQLDKNFIDAYYSLAVLQKKIEEYHKSLETLNTLLELAPDSVNARALKKLILTKYIK